MEGEGGQVGEEEEGESLIRPCQQRSVWATVPVQGQAQPTTTPATKMETGPCLKRMKITVRTPVAAPFFSSLPVSLFRRLLSLLCFVLRSMFFSGVFFFSGICMHFVLLSDRLFGLFVMTFDEKCVCTSL